jgi:anti-sigma regulatory factor (Ser/Thr protein kinase)
MLLAEHVAAGAGQIRIVGELAATAFGPDWDWWARYEAAINHAYDEFPLWSMCAYDRRVTPPHVLDDVERTHPWVSANGNHPTNPRYLAPPAFLSPSRLIAPHPVEDTPPVAEFTEPTLPAVRHAVQQANQGRLGEDELADFVVAVNEVVTNALQHGTPPLRARLWATDAGLVLSVTDQGAGPSDPLAGLLPAAHAPVGGLGMWMAYQLCDHVAVGRDPNGGFTIRLTARAAR